MRRLDPRPPAGADLGLHALEACREAKAWADDVLVALALPFGRYETASVVVPSAEPLEAADEAMLEDADEGDGDTRGGMARVVDASFAQPEEAAQVGDDEW